MVNLLILLLTLFSGTIGLERLPFSNATQGYKEPQINTSVEGNSLCTQWFFFNKGVGTHANSELTYETGGKFEFLDTSFGIDCEVLWFSTSNQVVFGVYGDGVLLYRSDPMLPTTYPQHVRVPIRGVQKLRLVVEDGGDGQDYDHADWLDPKLIR